MTSSRTLARLIRLYDLTDIMMMCLISTRKPKKDMEKIPLLELQKIKADLKRILNFRDDDYDSLCINRERTGEPAHTGKTSTKTQD